MNCPGLNKPPTDGLRTPLRARPVKRSSTSSLLANIYSKFSTLLSKAPSPGSNPSEVDRINLQDVFGTSVASPHLLENDGGLDGALVLDALQRLAKVLELEGLVDDALGLDLARVEVVDGGGWSRPLALDVSFNSNNRYLRNMYVSEKEPMMVISSPKILDGGHETLAELEYTLGIVSHASCARRREAHP